MIVLAQANAENNGSPLVSLLFLALIGGAMYFFVIRPQRTRLRAVSTAQAGLEPGRDVILTSGIYGTVLHVESDKIGLEIAPGVQVTVARAAVAQLVPVSAEIRDDNEPGPPLS